MYDIITSESNGHVLEFNEKVHRYSLDGSPIIGTTTFIKQGYATSDALVSWMQGQSAEYVWEQLKAGADTTKVELIKASKTAYRKKSKEATDIGTIVHDYAYWSEKNDNERVSKILEEIEKHVDKEKIENGLGHFEEWAKENKDTDKRLEQIVASVDYRFGGKFDRLATRPGVGIVLSDYKTSSGIFHDQFIQLGAYSVALREWSGINVDALEILNFHKTGDFDRVILKKPEEIKAFEEQAIRCRLTHEFKQKWEADVRFRRKWGTK